MSQLRACLCVYGVFSQNGDRSVCVSSEQIHTQTHRLYNTQLGRWRFHTRNMHTHKHTYIDIHAQARHSQYRIEKNKAEEKKKKNSVIHTRSVEADGKKDLYIYIFFL